MESSKLTRTAAIALLILAGMTIQLSAQDNPQHKVKHHQYKVIDVGTLGGPTSGFNFNSRIINRRGSAVGYSDTSVFDPKCGCYVSHGFRWEHGVIADLGPLPEGANTFAIAINSSGTVAGVSENGLIDPVLGLPESVATTWRDSRITDLGTLGGSFSLPNDINSRGEAAGGAENTIPDPFDFGGFTLGLPSPTQWHAALWRNGTIQDLGTLGTGPDSFALFVNEHGQASGFSFTNSIVNPETGIPTVDPFFWENGRMVDVGTLGGVFGTGSGLNNNGQVIGQSDLVGDLTHHPYFWFRGVLTDIGTFGGDNGSAAWVNDAGNVVGEADFPGNEIHHAFLWKNGVMNDLKPVGSAPCSNAISINSTDQVVGNSTNCTGGQLGATLWDHGSIVDLNAFVPPGSGIFLIVGTYIGDRGEIAVSGSLANGDAHAFILLPCNHVDHEKGCRDNTDNPALMTRSPTITTQGSLAQGRLDAPRGGFAHRYRGFRAAVPK